MRSVCWTSLIVRLQESLKSLRLRSRDAVLYSVHVADGCTARLGTALRVPVRKDNGRDRRFTRSAP